jgi:uncharacterized protein (TIGR02145 family)
MRYLLLALTSTMCLLKANGQAEPVEIVFQVDMSNTEIVSEVSITGGSINGWNTDSHILTDENGDGIYQIVLELVPGGHEYRFANGGSLEIFEPFFGGCTVSTADGVITNRYLIIPSGETSIILPANCFEQCDYCFSPGCADPIACNYNENAFEDDGSCDYLTCAGCMACMACNYDAAATLDDGLCDYCFCGEGTQWVDSLQACMVTEAALMQACGEGTYWDDLAQACLTIETCQEDLDGDGVIGVNDLMQLLSLFGTDCEAEDVDPELGEFTCGGPVNYHGYDYTTVLIGEQCWFAENLRTLMYKNGDEIMLPNSDEEWTMLENTGNGGMAHPNGSIGAFNEFGALYNWNAVTDNRQLCPQGWHIPSHLEWGHMENFVGMEFSESLAWQHNYGNVGEAIKSAEWNCPSWNGQNVFGFSGLPAGYRGNSGYDSFGSFGYWWSSSSLADLDWSAQEDHGVFRFVTEAGSYWFYNTLASGSNIGISIRCLKD